MAGDYLDVSLVDDELLAEVELTANLIVAAADSDGPLSPDALDRLLFASETLDPTRLPHQRSDRSRPRHARRHQGGPAPAAIPHAG